MVEKIRYHGQCFYPLLHEHLVFKTSAAEQIWRAHPGLIKDLISLQDAGLTDDKHIRAVFCKTSEIHLKLLVLYGSDEVIKRECEERYKRYS